MLLVLSINLSGYKVSLLPGLFQYDKVILGIVDSTQLSLAADLIDTQIHTSSLLSLCHKIDWNAHLLGPITD